MGKSVAVNTSARPLLVYDGDCGFCGYWARYWHGLTGDRVDTSRYQQVAAQHPAIPVADFQRAVQYIAPDGHHASAAEASFLTLSHAPGKGIWLALYRKLPGLRAVRGDGLTPSIAALRAWPSFASASFCGDRTSRRRDTISSRTCSCACSG